MLHSEILCASNFNTIFDRFHAIGGQWYIEIFENFEFINPEICGHYGKWLEIHLYVLFSPNRREKILNRLNIPCTQDLRV